MTDTPRLVLPYIAESQASKYVTHNEALDALDALVQPTIIDRDLTAPPGGESEGDVYIPAATATGDWAGHEDDIAVYISAQYKFHTPDEGWEVYVQDENVKIRWDGAAWQVVTESTTFLGLSDTPGSYSGQALLGVRVNAGETALEFAAVTSVADFTDLGDVPSSYSGEGSKIVAVNAGETALEFIAQAGGSLGLTRGTLVRIDSDQTISDDSATVVTWDSTISDSLSAWDSSTKLIVPSGITQCLPVLQTRWEAVAGGTRRMRVLLNGSYVEGWPVTWIPVESALSPTNEVVLAASPNVLTVAPGDELTLEVYQDSGGDCDLIADGSTWFGLLAVTPPSILDLGANSASLTDAATGLFDIALADGEMAGGKIIATIRASDGTDHQALTQEITYAVVNKAGAYTTSIAVDLASEITVATSGTLTATWDIQNGTNEVTVRVTPAGSLTETTYDIYFTVFNQSPQTITLL